MSKIKINLTKRKSGRENYINIVNKKKKKEFQ